MSAICRLPGLRGGEGVMASHRVVQLSVHLGVQLVDGVHRGREVDEEFSYFLQALVVFDLATFREGPEEFCFIGSSVHDSLEEGGCVPHVIGYSMNRNTDNRAVFCS